MSIDSEDHSKLLLTDFMAFFDVEALCFGGPFFKWSGRIHPESKPGLLKRSLHDTRLTAADLEASKGGQRAGTFIQFSFLQLSMFKSIQESTKCMPILLHYSLLTISRCSSSILVPWQYAILCLFFLIATSQRCIHINPVVHKWILGI